MKKKLLVVGIIMVSTITTIGATSYKKVTAYMKNQPISWKGQLSNQQALDYKGNIYVPLRTFSNLAGVEVNYKNGIIYVEDHTTSEVNGTNNNIINKQLISEQTAKEIALKHANLSNDQVIFLKTNLDREGHRWIYEIEFYSNFKEYDYEIDAETREIVSYNFDIENYSIQDNHTNNTTNIEITKEKAENIALQHVGLNKSQVYFIKTEKDWENHKQIYEIEFYYGGLEYSFEIDAMTGTILEYSKERD